MSSAPTSTRRGPDGWIVATMAVLLTSMIAHSAIRPMVSYRALELGASAATVGLIAGGYATAALALAIPFGRASDRFGAGPLMIVGTLGTAASIGAVLFIEGLVALGATQVVFGATHLATQIGLQTMLAKGSDPRNRDGLFGAMAAIASLAQMIGPVAAGGFTDGAGRTSAAVFIFGTLIAVAATVISVPLLRHRATTATAAAQRAQPASAPQPSRRRRAAGSMTTWQLLRIHGVPRALTINFTIIASVDLIVVYLPVYGQARGLPVTVVTTLLAIRAGTSMVSRAVMSPLIKAAGRKRLLAAGSLLPGLALFAVPLTTDTVALVVLMSITGFFLGLGQPLTLVWVINQVPARVQGAVLGLRLSGNKAVQLVLPVVSGALAASLGVAAAFWLIAGMLTAGTFTLVGADFDGVPRTSGDGP